MFWELISANKKKSLFLFASMAVFLALLGYFIGMVFDPVYGGVIGLIIAIGIWMGLSLISYFSGDEILLKVSGAREVTKDIHPRLFNVVEEMKIAAGLPALPKIYIIDEPAPNAFAIGVRPEKSAVAVTAGLLSRLNRDELQGVVAHEVSHIMNRDSQLMTVAGIMLGSIVLLSQFFLRSLWFMPSSSRRYRRGASGGGPQLQMIIVVVAILLAILSPIFARLLYLAISRKREYLADATAAQLTRYPEGLASALSKISQGSVPLESANQVTAPMYIVSPLMRQGEKLTQLSSTHPPIEERIRILRKMTGGAGVLDYQRAFAKVKGKPTGIIPASGLKKGRGIEIREPHREAEGTKDSKTAARDTMDLMRAVNGYAFLVCACNLKIKLPPNLATPEISCPRCGRINKLPVAEVATLGAMVGAATAVGTGADTLERKDEAGETLEYTRQGSGWETFSCVCGTLMQLSPAFSASHKTCRSCGRVTRIKS
jgi:heat shock protein HtpX